LAFLLGAFLMGGTLLLFILARDTQFFENAFNLRHLNDAEIRGLLYIFISVSGQATIFVTRTRGFSYMDRPANILLFAFCLAQTIATFIGVYGLRGYPHNGVQDFRGCGWGYAVVAWVWSLLWFIPLDFIKMFCFKFIFGKSVMHPHIPARFHRGEKGAFREASKEGKEAKKKGKTPGPHSAIDMPEGNEPNPASAHDMGKATMPAH